MTATSFGKGKKAHCLVVTIPVRDGVRVSEDRFVIDAIFEMASRRDMGGRRWVPIDFMSVGHVKHFTSMPMGHSVGDAFQIVNVFEGKPDQLERDGVNDFLVDLVETLKPYVPYDRSRQATIFLDGEAWPIPPVLKIQNAA